MLLFGCSLVKEYLTAHRHSAPDTVLREAKGGWNLVPPQAAQSRAGETNMYMKPEYNVKMPQEYT